MRARWQLFLGPAPAVKARGLGARSPSTRRSGPSGRAWSPPLLLIECTRRAPRDNSANALRVVVRRLWPFLALVLLTACRDVRVQTLKTGTTPVLGGNEIAIVRDAP